MAFKKTDNNGYTAADGYDLSGGSFELQLDKLEGISGGTLPENWQTMADQLIPMYLNDPQYQGITYEQACELLKSFITDPDDYAAICEYAKKYF